ncbi:hypothetical protein [Serratia ficaria]|uniref:hypothetical protein n=1 Tax=Serratia ficaria TaxID=61651 RepID=UPI0021B80381|nr:hypothetical protein [Serratia ficaria]
MEYVKSPIPEPAHYINDAARLAFTRLFPNDFQPMGELWLVRLCESLYFEHAVDSVEEGLATTLIGQYFHVWRTSERHYVNEYINNNDAADISPTADDCQKSYPIHYAILEVLSKSEMPQNGLHQTAMITYSLKKPLMSVLHLKQVSD